MTEEKKGRKNIMKFKTTQKEIKANYNTIICVPYCGLPNLLRYEEPIAYTERREGWAADIYNMGNGVAIVTGYAPFGKIRPSYEQRQKYEMQAKKVTEISRSISNWNGARDEKAELKKLQAAFVKEVLSNE